jgi:cellulose biosynthesis protein BcsQ
VQSVALTALKGGVGKTSTTVNLAALAAAAGHRTLVWDIDPQAGATACLGVKPKLRGGAQRLLGGDRDLANAIRRSSIDGLDVLPGDVSLREADVIADLGAPSELLAPFLSLVDRRKPLHRKLMDEVRTERRFLASAIPVSSAVERMPMEQVPTVVAAPRSLASLALRDLWGEVSDRLDL